MENYFVCVLENQELSVPQLVNGDIFDMPALLLLLDLLVTVKGDNLDDDFFFGIS